MADFDDSVTDPVGTHGTLDHVSVGVSDVAAARTFYDAALAPLGLVRAMGEGMGDDSWGWGYGKPNAFAQFWVQLPYDGGRPQPGNGCHVALRATNRAAVDAFHAAALAAGATCDGPPGLRSYHPTYYAAFIRDPDGNKIEAVTHV
ncbi:MAG: VOC family protein [Alphaproteobacteria bacterium]|nr:VOC family protein [Alphaproteobacteria bacterium]TAD88415.1 MAG: VOC family protein [Alphaproteobacteria bacterium]